MTFLARELLWLLLLIPLLIGGYVALLRRRTRAVTYSSTRIIREAITRRHALRRHVAPCLVLLALTALLLGMARPTSQVNLLAAQRTIVLVMDVSLSMAATDVRPSRLAAAQAAAKGFIRQQPSDVRMAVVAFAGTAELVQPPTANRRDLVDAIDRLRLEYHTAIGSGLIAALITLFPDAGLERGYDIFGGATALMRAVSTKAAPAPALQRKAVPPGSHTSGAIVLLTDGSRTMGPDPLAAARTAADFGVRVYTVGFGGSERARVAVDGWSMEVGFDEPALKSIAEITRGAYFHADTAERLQDVYQDLSARFVVERRDVELGALFAAAAAVLALGAAVASFAWGSRVA
jgi:Ca-activated chloride channel family protein